MRAQLAALLRGAPVVLQCPAVVATLALFASGPLRAQPISDASEDLKARWDAYVQRTYSWKRIGILTAETAFDRTFQLRKCGRFPFCFPHDIGGALTRRTAGTSIEFGVSALLQEDMRRRPSNLTGLPRRAAYALLHAPLAARPDGRWRPCYSRIAGTFGGIAVSSAWNGRPLTASRLFEGFGWSLTSQLQDALWTEFEPDMKRIGHRIAGRLWRRHPASPPSEPSQASIAPFSSP